MDDELFERAEDFCLAAGMQKTDARDLLRSIFAGSAQAHDLPIVPNTVGLSVRAGLLLDIAAALAPALPEAVASSSAPVSASPALPNLTGESRAMAIRAAAGEANAALADALIKSSASTSDAFAAIRIARETAAAPRHQTPTVAERAGGASFGSFASHPGALPSDKRVQAGWERGFAKAVGIGNHAASSGGPGEMAAATETARAGWSKAFAAEARAEARRVRG